MYECDTDRFVDDYMRLKKDGHIKFYTKDDWTDICCNQGLIILDSYDLAETDTELYITERVNYILFMKE